ncbi:Nucleoside-diphosphate-sugar epimerase [Devosia enhydra]|uniref:Nucleoside-diphosphate-sugar epimerase n=1 Tax=Devosia enhydra TaxID=665118 RepID=A0A1K2I008_9HYPH|nr:NAD-dependent epimerase/dehydratase family protein [Devosia enhydra]SFZ85725.1 Nucleoside-diphosphate-sugar epimerase [Devosia enhydra]
MSQSAQKPRIVILGLNGHIGQAAAKAFIAAGWSVTGFARSNRMPIAGVDFVAGTADSVPDMRAAIGDADIVLNALNLPYDKWDRGRAEAQLGRVLKALGRTGKTLLFPGNVYNYAASDRALTPDLPQYPETPRGAIRVRMEEMLLAAARRGDINAIILRAGDFYGPGNHGNDMFGQMILREIGKGRVALHHDLDLPHAWAYLPDLARAFVALAERRGDFEAFARFNFAGHFLTGRQILKVVEDVAGHPLRAVPLPWTMLSAMGLVMPLMREIVKTRYLWENPMALVDPRLEAILGPGFGTDPAESIRATVAPILLKSRVAA